MNPVVIMAMHQRHSLVEINLRLLSEQKCQIVVVASLADDFVFLRSLNIPHLQIVPHPNEPLGAKWQSGVDQCKILRANPLITLGSDDYLSQNFIEKACQLSQKHDLVYFTRWYIYDQNTGQSYYLRYKNIFPLGSGRVFSGQFLDKINWKLYDSSLNIHLDDYIFNNLKGDDSVLINPEEMELLSIKGKHESMNSLDRILSAETITWNYCHNIDKQFNFSKPIKEIFHV